MKKLYKYTETLTLLQTAKDLYKTGWSNFLDNNMVHRLLNL